MRSIPRAVVWELLYHGRWVLAAGFLGANFMPLAVESALARDGAIDPNDMSQIMMHLVLTQTNLLMFGLALMWASGKPSRLYSAPVTTSTLVTWQLVPAMILLFVESVFSTLLMNSLFPVNWPIWGPALFAAVAYAATCAAMWQTEKTGWVVVSLTFVALILGLWFKTRYGGLSGPHEHYWREVTVSDVATLIAFAAVSFYFAIKGVARDRRGETLRSLGIIAWIERVFDPAPDIGAPFRSAEDSHFWYVWSQKGWAMPICVVFGAFLGVVGWSIFDRKPDSLLEAFEVGGILLGVIGMLGGMIIGNCGPNDATFEMGNFLGTRPMKSTVMSRILLKTIIRTVMISWILWAILFSVVCLIMWAFGLRPQLKVFTTLGWWYIPLTLLAPWTVTTVGAALGLTGRSWPLGVLFFGGCFTLVCSMVAAQMLLSRDAQFLLLQGVTLSAGILAVLATIAAYVIARRRALVESAAFYSAVLAWLLMCAPVVYYGATHVEQILPNHLVTVIGLLALAVAPFSTIPLAVSWNRVR